MTQPGIELRSPGPLVNTLPSRQLTFPNSPSSDISYIYIYIEREGEREKMCKGNGY